MNTMKRLTEALASVVTALALVGALGCPTPPPATSDGGPDGGAASPDAGVDDFAVSTRNHLLWKRAHAFEEGLGAALFLAPDEVCKELSRSSCVQGVHLVALGGNDPFEQGMHEPMAEPTATTPVAVERVAIAACQHAVAEDAARAVPLLFLDLDLDPMAAPLDLSSEAVLVAVEDSLRRVGQRLLARDLSARELQTLKELTVDDDGAAVTARDFAVLSCFALATLTENVFF